MCKIAQKTIPKIEPSLDKSGQLRKIRLKRYRKKAKTVTLCNELKELKSELHESYMRSFGCNQIIVVEDGKARTTYCGQRWCYVCNGIRTAKLIQGYEPILAEFKEPMFVTISRPNVRASQLRKECKLYVKLFRKVRDTNRKRGITMRGIRALEITQNEKRAAKNLPDYHPHYHLIVDGAMEAEQLVKDWLEYNPTANRSAQDIRHADAGSMKELFKYGTKLAYKPAKVLDTIFCSIRGLRMVQSFGINIQISEELEDHELNQIEDLPPELQANDIWIWNDDVMDHVSTIYGYLMCEVMEAAEKSHSPP